MIGNENYEEKFYFKNLRKEKKFDSKYFYRKKKEINLGEGTATVKNAMARAEQGVLKG